MSRMIVILSTEYVDKQGTCRAFGACNKDFIGEMHYEAAHDGAVGWFASGTRVRSGHR